MVNGGSGSGPDRGLLAELLARLADGDIDPPAVGFSVGVVLAGILAVMVGVLVGVPALLAAKPLFVGLAAAAAVALLAGTRVNSRAVSTLTVLFALGTVLAFWYPLFQPALYGLLVGSPALWYWAAIVGGLLVASQLVPERSAGTRRGLVVLASVLAVVAVFVAVPLAGGYTSLALSAETMGEAESLDRLPETTAENSRIAPRGVSRNRAVNSLQYSRYTLGECDITFLDDTPHWSCPLEPDGLRNTLFRQQIGAVYVNQSTVDKDIVVADNASFQTGLGMGLTDGLRWQLARNDPLKSYGDAFVVPHGEESFIAVPYQTHSWEFRATPIPQPHAVPRFGGVKLVAENGTIRDLSPEQARDSAVLAGQNFYPYSLARKRVAATAYRNGLANTLPVVGSHEDQIEISEIPGEDNRQPFTVPTEDGIKYFVAAEPWGQANGVREIWTVDGRTGDAARRQYDTSSTLRGPRKAESAIMGEPELARLQSVESVEPIPVVRDGTTYWQVRVTPTSSASITAIGFFNAQTETVTIVETTAEVRAFLAGDQVVDGGGDPADGGDGGDGDTGTDGTVVIVVEDEDGTQQRIPVEEGSTISITVPENNATNATATAG